MKIKMEIYIYPFFLGGRFWRKTHFYAIKFLFGMIWFGGGGGILSLTSLHLSKLHEYKSILHAVTLNVS